MVSLDFVYGFMTEEVELAEEVGEGEKFNFV